MKSKTTANQIPDKPLTETELEMMNLIWKLGPCTVNQILDGLPKDRPLAYTSVSTIVRILEQKGYVESKKIGRGHAYAATLTKEQYQEKSINYIVRNVFDGAPLTLVCQLLKNDGLSQHDLQEIQNLLNRKA